MTRFSILALAALTLAACRTEPTDGSSDSATDTAETAASPTVMTDSTSGPVEFAAPRRDPGADAKTRQATLKDVIADGEECFVMASDAEGDLLLMGTAEACADGAGLKGQAVTLTQETASLDVPLGGGTSAQPVELVVGIKAAN